MDVVRVSIPELIEKLKENRDQHHNIFLEALEGYKARAVELLEEHIERIRAGKVEQVNVILPQPVDRTSDYNRVIAMLEMTARAGEEIIELGQGDFSRYVLDEWHWKDEFLTTNSIYAMSLQGG